jgi:predicted dehydrogenase
VTDLRLAVIGSGKFGENHVRLLGAMPGVRLVAVCERDPVRAGEVARKYEVTTVADYRELADRVDAVVVVTPTETHLEIAEFFLAHGKGVFLEKPMTRTLEEADRLVGQCEQGRGVLQVGHIERFNPIVRQLGDFPLPPRFIEIDRLTPFPRRSLDVDVIMDLMIHDLDLLCAWVPSELAEVRAVGVPVLTSRVDMVSARLEFTDGCVATVTTSRVSLSPTRKFRLFFADRYVSLDLQQREAVVAWKKPASADAFPEIAFETLRAEPEANPLQDELSAFLTCVREGTPPLVGVREGRRAIRLAGHVAAAIGEHLDRYGF